MIGAQIARGEIDWLVLPKVQDIFPLLLSSVCCPLWTSKSCQWHWLPAYVLALHIQRLGWQRTKRVRE